jgi:hypothetical protein
MFDNTRLRSRSARTVAILLSLAALGSCKQKHAGTEDAAQAAMGAQPELEPFSFFVTSLAAMQRLSGNAHGFGGDLRYGEADGLSGADKICTQIAEESMPGAGRKGWRAFLSTVRGGPNGGPVHAIDRVGDGPWYDRLGRLVSMTKADLLQQRPNADEEIKDDLPNELGVPNHNPDGTGEVDNHDILTGSNDKGQLFENDVRYTCDDWTKSAPDKADSPRVGHSWPRNFGNFPGGGFPRPPAGEGGGRRPLPPGFPDGGVPDGGFPPPPPGGFPGFDPANFPDGGFPPPPPGGFPGFDPSDIDFSGFGDPANWMSSLNEAGCGPGAFVVEMGPPMESNPTVGSGGGYGGIYCFALTP